MRDPPPSAAVRGRVAPGWVGRTEGTRGDSVVDGERGAGKGRPLLGGRCWVAVVGDCADAILGCFCRRLERSEPGLEPW